MKKLIALLLCVVCLAQSAFAASPAESARDLALSAVSGQKFLAGVSGELLAQGEDFPAGTSVCDWTAIAFALLGAEDGAAYLAAENEYISANFPLPASGRAPVATDWQRAALTVRALGGDPTACGTDGSVDLIAGGVYDYAGDSLGMQGLNGWIFALIALDCGGYEVPKGSRYTREDIYLHENWDEAPLALFDPRNGDTHSRDFFGGDLQGIISKLDYLQSLHVTVLYLNPIFLARSNHRYDTGDYTRIDPMLGTQADLTRLCEEAAKRGMRVLLDGVFNHTGDDSLYFNRYGRYDSVGAYQSPDSPYAGWFTFERFPDKYKCWWGVDTLPEVNKDNEDYRRFILAEDGVARRWMRAGTAGWRLDVADELPMRFLRDLRTAVRTQDAQAALLGEVWEDASNKVSYGAQRCYCLGDTLDSVMNYPLREAAIGFVTGTLDAYAFCRRVESLRENYPLPFFYSLMNLMGSHDRARLLNVLAGETWEQVDPLERGGCRLSDAQRALAIRRLAEMWKLYAALPGMPSVYYGDEAGMEGAADPFCRFPYPWGREDAQVMTITREALALRASRPILRRGALQLHPIDRDTVRIRRFAYAGCDVFGEPLDDAEFEINVHAIHA